MPECAFLTMDSLDEFEVYDDLLIEPMAELGWAVSMVSWRAKEVDWNAFDAVIIRSPWDYQDEPVLFMQVLETIHESSARLENPLSTVKWNINKTYLKELQEKDVLIVPTLWENHFEEQHLKNYVSLLSTDKLIIKPTISANADDTFWLDGEVSAETIKSLEHIFSEREFMVQPFMEHILREGEYSLFYFGGIYSHTILKTPGDGDFRVQEEHGGRLESVEPENGLLTAAEETMQHLHPTPLYARIDYVRTQENSFALMELELIEPSLYFNMDPNSPERFARIFDAWMKEKSVKS